VRPLRAQVLGTLLLALLFLAYLLIRYRKLL
jgi:cbb3-type cytochrome oxidase subunit 3